MVKYANDQNIDGPACVEVPEWVPNKLGRYYLYFASHWGDHIRLAYADELTGPWSVREGGVFNLSQAVHCKDHIASPDVVVDHGSRTMVLFYHGVDKVAGEQLTYAAASPDGLSFGPACGPVAQFYLRLVKWKNLWIGMSKGGTLYVSKSLDGPLRPLSTPALPICGADANAFGTARHVALLVDGDVLWVAFSRIGDAPEHIRLGYMDLSRQSQQWRIEADVQLLMPEKQWEGAGLPIVRGRPGPARTAEHALRDPFLIQSEGRLWLFYSAAGEQSIGLVELPDLNTYYAGMPKHRPWLRAMYRAPIDRVAKPLLRPVHRKLMKLSKRLRLKLAFAGITRFRPEKYIYLMGCGRSGTWLLTSLMAQFEDTEVFAKESRLEAFLEVRTRRRNLVVKRSPHAYRHASSIPERVFVLYIIRHPFDVLTSHNPNSGSKYHITPDRWLGEMTGLKSMIDGGRKRLLVLTYEDLVTQPRRELEKVAASLGLRLSAGYLDGSANADLPAEAVLAMHGVRPVDTNSIGRHLRNPEAIEYLHGIRPQLAPMLEWVASRFGYQVTLPCSSRSMP
jgi:hypothetical protein